MRDRQHNVVIRTSLVALALVAFSVTAIQAAKEPVLMDPKPAPSGGSKAPAVAPGLQEWMEVEVDRTGFAFAPLMRSDVSSESAAPLAPDVTPPPTVQWDAIVQPGAAAARPPDDHVAAGPGLGAAGRVVEVTNSSVRIYDKLGTPITGIVPLATMFPPAPGTFVFDPKILFDQHSGRFFIVVLEVGFAGPVCGSPLTSSRILLAVSTGGAPNTTGPLDWTFLAGSGLIPIGPPTWADYPSIGADSNSLFVTTNQFNGACAFAGANIRVFDKAALLGGVYGFVDITLNAAVLPGVGTVQPAHVYGATDNGGFYLINRIGPGTYRLYNITGDPAAPVLATGVFPWAGGTFPADTSADQCGVALPDLDTIPARLMNAVYRSGQLWTTHTSQADADAQTEVVWHQIRTNSFPGAAPAVSQAGFLNGTGAGPWTYMPSINVNASGDALINFSQSAAGQCASMFAAHRLNADPPGTFQAQALARASASFYDSVGAGGVDRWGDYSGNAVDPNDQCFWTSNEYAATSVAGASTWGTHIAKFCPSSEGACCFGRRICGMRTPTACASQGGTFRGAGSKCPTQMVQPIQESFGPVVHSVDPAFNCNTITPLVAPEGTSTCCNVHASPGCDNTSCANTVCGTLPHCCADGWDANCVKAAETQCGTLCDGGPACQPGISFDAWITSTEPGQPTCNQFGSPPEPPIPPNFFYPGSQPFIGQVCYGGQPLGPTPFGDFDLADTLVRRFGDPFDRCTVPGAPDASVPIQLVALNLVSLQPIIVTGSQPQQQWTVKLTISDVPSPQGTMTATKTHCNGGTWDSTLPVQAKFTFTNVNQPSQIRVLDTGLQGMLPILLESSSDNQPWVHDLDPNLNIPPATCTNFHPGIQDPSQSLGCDCNGNGRHDQCDVESASSPDCNRNLRPDECDPDSDFDLAIDGCDNCPMNPNPGQENADVDRYGDLCDLCPLLTERLENDHDGDKVRDVPNIDFPTAPDNCPCDANVDQANFDGDSMGDVCDPDDDNDLDPDGSDCAPLNAGSFDPPGQPGIIGAAKTAPATAQYTWSAASGGSGAVYDVVWDLISALPVGPGAGEQTSCDQATTSMDLVGNPGANQGFWLVIRSQNACGVGTYGDARLPLLTPRSTSACP